MNDPHASDDRQLADAWSGPERPACQEAQVRGAMRRTFALVREGFGNDLPASNLGAARFIEVFPESPKWF